MIESSAVVSALTHYSHGKTTVTTEGRVVAAIVLAVVGLGALGMARLGWHGTAKLVPSSLPEDLYWRRHRVLRRGAAAFAVLGALFLVVAVWVVASG